MNEKICDIMRPNGCPFNCEGLSGAHQGHFTLKMVWSMNSLVDGDEQQYEPEC